jgi:hypothetical protein
VASTRQARLRYPIRVAGTMHPAGTLVEVVAADDPVVQRDWPGMRYREGSTQVAVRFPDRDRVTICASSQIDPIDPPDLP